MNKIALVLKTNYRINCRINSEKHPLLYFWLQSVGIKMPPEILAYVILFTLLITFLLGLLAETASMNPLARLNVFYSGGVLALSLIIAEIFIKAKKLEINPLLLKIIPVTKKQFAAIKVLSHFISLRLWCFISFAVLYIVFSSSYNYKLLDRPFIMAMLFFTNVFMFITALTFFYSEQTERISFHSNKNLVPVIRLFSILVLLIAVKKISVYASLVHITGSIDQDIQINILPITIISFLIFVSTIVICAQKKI